MSTWYNLLVVGHLLCVIGGFGTLAYSGLYLSLARRRGPATSLSMLEISHQVSIPAELLIYGAFVFGIAAVVASHSAWSFSQGWVSAAFALFIIDVGILHGVIKPGQRNYAALCDRLASVGVGAGDASASDAGASDGGSGDGGAHEGGGSSSGKGALRTADVAGLTALEKRVSLGWGAFNLIVIVVVYLMVFKPAG